MAAMLTGGIGMRQSQGTQQTPHLHQGLQKVSLTFSFHSSSSCLASSRFSLCFAHSTSNHSPARNRSHTLIRLPHCHAVQSHARSQSLFGDGIHLRGI